MKRPALKMHRVVAVLALAALCVPIALCTPVPCQHTTEVNCTMDTGCEWLVYSDISSASATYEVLVPVKPFPGTKCNPSCACASLDSFFVRIGDGYVRGKDSLTCGACSAAGVTVDVQGGSLAVSGLTSDKFAEVMDSIEFTTKSNDNGKRSLTWNFGTTLDVAAATTACGGTVDLVRGMCGTKKCDYIGGAMCEADPFCFLAGGTTCVIAPCVLYPNEKECLKNPGCQYDVSTPDVMCKEERCRVKDIVDCNAEDECMWNATQTKCVKKECSQFDSCKCRADDRCHWDVRPSVPRCVGRKYEQCPVLDLVMLLDGSGSMGLSFGRHPNGFYALMEMMRNWVSTLPLTGEDHTVGRASTASSGGLRMGIIQFSGPVPEAVRTPVGVGSSGSLTGDLTELQDDIDWHEANFMQGLTTISTGLNWAGAMFQNSPPRQKVLIIVTDGPINDDASSVPQRAVLLAEGVRIFGVVLRRTTARTKLDDDAELILKPITSDPHDEHFINIPIDEMPDKVLNGICDPNMWGQLLIPAFQDGMHEPCSQHLLRTGCTSDPGCIWSSVALVCEDSSCMAHCEESSCVADTVNSCQWKKVNGTESPSCWVLCSHGDQATCESDLQCDWEGSECVLKPCTQSSEASCYKDSDCHWDISISPGQCAMTQCATMNSDKLKCDSFFSCVYENNKCVKKECSMLDMCSCGRDGDCFWNSKGFCTAQEYGLCPTLDLVLLVDGSLSMTMQFGRHPNGFEAVMEMIRSWVAGLPLSGEIGSVGKSSRSGTEKVRVGVVQFSSVGNAAGALVTPAGVGSSGSLTGSLQELSSDIDWQEDNFYGGGTFLEKGLELAVEMFKASPADGRQRVLVIVADGSIVDGNSVPLGVALGRLSQVQVKVFGIVIRRTSTSTDVDTEALDALKPVVSTPIDDHSENIQLGTLPNLLDGICSPNTKFGIFIARNASGHQPCALYSVKKSCNTDSNCVWDESKLLCASSPCMQHCTDQVACIKDGCSWNASQHLCQEKPRVVCSALSVNECTSDAECKLSTDGTGCVGRRCVHSIEQSCINDPDGCVWYSISQTCEEKPCTYQKKTTCEKDSACSWEDTVGCAEKCTATSEAKCNANRVCYWNERDACVVIDTVVPATQLPATAVPTTSVPTRGPEGNSSTPTITLVVDTAAPATLVPGSSAVPTNAPTLEPGTTQLPAGSTAVPTSVPALEPEGNSSTLTITLVEDKAAPTLVPPVTTEPAGVGTVVPTPAPSGSGGNVMLVVLAAVAGVLGVLVLVFGCLWWKVRSKGSAMNLASQMGLLVCEGSYTRHQQEYGDDGVEMGGQDNDVAFPDDMIAS